MSKVGYKALVEASEARIDIISASEALDKLGGLMLTNIPSFRLPARVLEEEIGFIVDMGLDKNMATCSVPEGCYRITNPTDDMDVITAVEQDHARSGVSCTLCHQVVVDQMDIHTFPNLNGA